jgi:hypothetical protein
MFIEVNKCRWRFTFWHFWEKTASREIFTTPHTILKIRIPRRSGSAARAFCRGKSQWRSFRAAQPYQSLNSAYEHESKKARLLPHERTGRGIGRTFQNVRLFTSRPELPSPRSALSYCLLTSLIRLCTYLGRYFTGPPNTFVARL